MGNIRLLTQDTINQIAAGEVIDRPSSIVKELLENSIDAGATFISVEIKDGGTSLIRITDNGVGIAKEDIQTAFLRHSTSKIRSVEDLITVSSLGFRGEALSSIAAVCQVELFTKTKDTLMGSRYIIEGGKEILLEDVGLSEGTTFIVKNIFFNTPARRKFLKSAQTEAGYISDVIEKIALSHPEVSIRFINNNVNKLHTPGNNNLKDVIYNVYGRDVAGNLLEINANSQFMTIKGYLGKPIINKGNRSFENYFINGRYIKSGIVSKAIEDAYKPFLMQHKYPFCALHMSIDSELLDVNVHPAKMELRFKNAEELYPFLVESISNVLREKPLIPQVKIDDKNENSTKTIDRERKPEPFETRRMIEDKTTDIIEIITDKISEPNTTITGYNIEEKEICEVKKQNSSDYLKSENVTHLSEETKYTTVALDANLNPNEVKLESNKISSKIDNTNQMTLFEENFLSEQARPKHRIVGQVFDTYWIVEYEGKMFIIDQHAAHEKVLYEQLINRLNNKSCMSQVLNPPIIISLSSLEETLLNKYMTAFNQLGFEIEAFGGKEFAVRAIPMDLYSLNKRELIMDIIDSLTNENVKISSELLTDKIASMSCKAAVKGNNRLTYAEASELIDKLLKLDNPYNCPHGRPTIISMSKYELEKKFKRII